MIRRFTVTIGFFFGILRDLAGSLRCRWRRFHARAVLGEEIGAVGVDIYPFFERGAGITAKMSLVNPGYRRESVCSRNLRILP